MLDCPARMNTSVGIFPLPATAVGAARRAKRRSSIVAAAAAGAISL
jgi:hypothetical protein